jgi:hypothetical protein
MRSLRFVLAVMLAFGAFAAACANDFATFEGGPAVEAGVESGTDTGAGTDSSSGGTDGSSGGTDSSIVDSGGDGNPCPTVNSCLSAQIGCRQICDQTYTTCVDNCNGNNCQNKCRDDRDTCRSNCTKTCTNCAGLACANRCL